MKVVVLTGGISTERDVSLSSGMLIYNTLKESGYQAILLDAYLGHTAFEEENVPDLFSRDIDWARGIKGIGVESPDLDRIKAMRADGGRSYFGPGVISLCQAADVVFMALHGDGENGKIQACFDLMGITYTGTGAVGSTLAMDKGLAKDLFRCHGIPTPAGISVKQGGSDEPALPFPRIVKVNGGGSSVGVYVAKDESEYQKALAAAYRYEPEVIVEQYIAGREFSVGVLGGKALPVIEIAPLEGFYDYKNKYQAGNAVETCPALLDEGKTGEMQQWAEKVFRVLRLKNYARIDFMMNEQGELFCLEANTLPGMTPTSLLPQEAAAAGINFSRLCDQIINYALAD